MDNKTNYNKHIADNLKLAIKSQGLTQGEVAQKAGITPKTLRNMLSGSARIDVNLAAEIYSTLGYDPESIIRPPKNNIVLTNIRPIDVMLRRIYNQYAYSGVVALGEYVSDDYRCCSPQYNQWDCESLKEPFYSIKDKKGDGIELWGMSYESELRLTSENLQEEIHTIEPQHATVITDHIIGISILRTTISEETASTDHVLKYGNDYLTLDTSIKKITREAANFKVTQKLWNHQIRAVKK
jgi:transcriptional regulator with XRE-family HTH domain